MRVLLTTDTVGGVWTFTCELTAGLLRRGHSVALLSFGRDLNAHQRAWADVTEADYPETFFFRSSDAPLEWMEANEHAWKRGAAALEDVLQRAPFEPSLLHSNQFCFGNFDAGIPTLVTAHSDVLSWAQACRPEGLPDTAWLRCYKRLVREGIEAASAVVAPSGWMATTLARIYAYERKCLVIPNGRSAPGRAATPPQRELRAITAGRLWDPAKGLAALAQVHSPLPIAIAGDASLHPGDRTSPGLPERCELLGPLGADALFHLFQRSALYLATSFYEPFGLAPLEAALCGCAIVARDIPSFREIWGDAAVYFHNAGELQSQLNELASQPARLAALRARSQARAVGYTAERMTHSYLALYEACLLNAGWTPDEFAYGADEVRPGAPLAARMPQHAL